MLCRKPCLNHYLLVQFANQNDVLLIATDSYTVSPQIKLMHSFEFMNCNVALIHALCSHIHSAFAYCKCSFSQYITLSFIFFTSLQVVEFRQCHTISIQALLSLKADQNVTIIHQPKQYICYFIICVPSCS